MNYSLFICSFICSVSQEINRALQRIQYGYEVASALKEFSISEKREVTHINNDTPILSGVKTIKSVLKKIEARMTEGLLPTGVARSSFKKQKYVFSLAGIVFMCF